VSGPDTDLPTFFKILAASLAADRERNRAAGLPERPAERKHPAQKASKASLARQAAKVAQAKAAAKNKRGPKSRIPVLAAAAAIVIVAGVLAAMPRGSEPLPEQMIGAWTTTAQKYADRTFELSAEEIAFQQGAGGQMDRHPITGVHSDRDAGGTLVYVIEYDNDKSTYEFSFVYQPVENSIRMKNQPQVVWHRK